MANAGRGSTKTVKYNNKKTIKKMKKALERLYIGLMEEVKKEQKRALRELKSPKRPKFKILGGRTRTVGWIKSHPIHSRWTSGSD